MQSVRPRRPSGIYHSRYHLLYFALLTRRPMRRPIRYPAAPAERIRTFITIFVH